MIDFSEDEKIYLNHCALECSLASFLTRMSFQQFVDRQDKDISDFFLQLRNKLEALSDSEWEVIQNSLPFETVYEWGDEDYSNHDTEGVFLDLSKMNNNVNAVMVVRTP